MAGLGSYQDTSGIPRSIAGVALVDAAGASVVKGNSRVLYTGEPVVAAISRSATVGTTSSVIIPANASRSKFIIQNDTASDIWINLTRAATAVAGGGNIRVAAGGFFQLYGSTNAVTAIVATGTAAITAYEF